MLEELFNHNIYPTDSDKDVLPCSEDSHNEIKSVQGLTVCLLAKDFRCMSILPLLQRATTYVISCLSWMTKTSLEMVNSSKNFLLQDPFLPLKNWPLFNKEA